MVSPTRMTHRICGATLGVSRRLLCVCFLLQRVGIPQLVLGAAGPASAQPNGSGSAGNRLIPELLPL